MTQSQYDNNAFQRKVYSNTSSRRWITEQWDDVSGKDVLDVGCGNGMDLQSIVEGNGNAFGIDNSSAMVAASVDRFKSMDNRPKIKSMDMLRMGLELPTKSFDIITARHSIHHVKDVTPVILHAHNLLRPSGKFIFVVINSKQYEERYGEGKCHFTIYGNVQVEAYAHKLSDYLSPEFFKLFELKSYGEGVGEEAEPINSESIWWAGFSAQKKL